MKLYYALHKNCNDLHYFGVGDQINIKASYRAGEPA